MRDYLSPAKRVVARAIPYPEAIRALLIKRRPLVFVMTATFVVITTLGFVTVRAMTASDAPESEKNIVKEEGKTSTLTTSTSTNAGSSDRASSTQSTITQSTTPPQGSDTHTSVSINNEQIPVPDNGTVQRTITNDNGTTRINVSTNSDSTGNSYSSSFTTNSTSMDTTMNSTSQNVTITGP